MSRFSHCPWCGKKGRYEAQGYDPNPDRGRLFLCRYCNYNERTSAKYGRFSAENEAIEDDEKRGTMEYKEAYQIAGKIMIAGGRNRHFIEVAMIENGASRAIPAA